MYDLGMDEPQVVRALADLDGRARTMGLAAKGVLADADRSVLCRWRALGIQFDVAPSKGTPDLERLLLDTARELPGNPRLLPMVVTWLRRYGDAVARNRLRRLIASELAPKDGPALALLLDAADEDEHPARFAAILRDLRPASTPAPLFDVERATAALADRARRRASDVSRRWGRWAEPVEPRPDTLAPPTTVMRRHPWLRLATDFRGDMRASVMSALLHDPDSRDSETSLARAAGGSRAQVRNALANLELTGRARRLRKPGIRRTQILPNAA
jgi:hypothetical protein